MVAPFTFEKAMLVPKFVDSSTHEAIDLPTYVPIPAAFAALLDENNKQVFFAKIGVYDGFNFTFTYVKDRQDTDKSAFEVDRNATRAFGAYRIENLSNIAVLPKQFPNFNGYLFMTYGNAEKNLEYDMSQCNNASNSDTVVGPGRRKLGSSAPPPMGASECVPNDPGHFDMTSGCPQAPRVCISDTNSVCFEVHSGSPLIIPVKEYLGGSTTFNISTTPDVSALLFTVPKGSPVETFRGLSRHGYLNVTSPYSVWITEGFSDQLVLSATRHGVDPLACLENQTGKRCCFMGPSNGTVLCAGADFSQISKVSFNSHLNCGNNCTIMVGDKKLNSGAQNSPSSAGDKVSIQLSSSPGVTSLNQSKTGFRYGTIRNATANDNSIAVSFMWLEHNLTSFPKEVKNTDPRLVWAYEKATGVIWALGDGDKKTSFREGTYHDGNPDLMTTIGAGDYNQHYMFNLTDEGVLTIWDSKNGKSVPLKTKYVFKDVSLTVDANGVFKSFKEVEKEPETAPIFAEMDVHIEVCKLPATENDGGAINRVDNYFMFEPGFYFPDVMNGMEVEVDNESEPFLYNATYTCGETEHSLSFKATKLDNGWNMETFLDSKQISEKNYEGDAPNLLVWFTYLGDAMSFCPDIEKCRSGETSRQS